MSETQRAESNTPPASDIESAPKGGLSEEKRERLAGFGGRLAKHSKLDTLTSETMRHLTSDNDADIIGIVGVTGAGKSTLTRVVLKKAYENYRKTFDENRALLPVISTEAGEATDAYTGLVELFEQILHHAYEPGIADKYYSEVRENRVILHSNPTYRLSALSQAVQKAIIARETEVVVIDEAYFLLKQPHLEFVMGQLRTIVNKTKAKILLVGSYDLMDLFTTNGQGARRALLLHFDRYHLDNKADREEFLRILKLLLRCWPCKEVPNLDAIYPILMEATFGVIGLLVRLLKDCASLQLADPEEKWRTEYLKYAVMSTATRAVIEKEILEGEAKAAMAVSGNGFFSDEDVKALDKILRESDKSALDSWQRDAVQEGSLAEKQRKRAAPQSY